MVTVISCLLCLVLMAWCSKKSQFPINQTIIILLVCIIGLRYNVGIDYANYETIYNDAYSDGALFIEPIWNWLNNFFRSFGFRARIFFFWTSLVIVVGFYKGIMKMSISFYSSLFLFLVCGFYFESGNLIRQYVAMALLFAGFYDFLVSKWWRYMIWVSAAALFHTSVLFIIPLLFLARIHFSVLSLVLIIILSLLFGDQILNTLINVIMPSLQEIGKYQYTADDFDTGVSTGLLKIFYHLLIFLILILYARFKATTPSWFYILLNMVVIGLVIYNVCYSFMAARRLYLYFFSYIIIVIPYCLKGFKYSSRYIAMGAICTVFFIFLLKLYTGVAYNFDFKFF